MRTLTDANGRTWNIDLNLGIALQIDQAQIQSVNDDDGKPTTVKFIGSDTNHLLIQQMADMYTVLQVAAVMVRSQLKDGETIEAAFYGALHAQTEFAELQKIIWDECSDFFPQMATLFGKLAKLHSELIKRSVSLSEKAGKQIDEQITPYLDKQTEAANKQIESVSIGEQT